MLKRKVTRTHLPEEAHSAVTGTIAAAVGGVGPHVCHIDCAALSASQQLVEFRRAEQAQPCGRNDLHSMDQVVSA